MDLSQEFNRLSIREDIKVVHERARNILEEIEKARKKYVDSERTQKDTEDYTCIYNVLMEQWCQMIGDMRQCET